MRATELRGRRFARSLGIHSSILPQSATSASIFHPHSLSSVSLRPQHARHAAQAAALNVCEVDLQAWAREGCGCSYFVSQQILMFRVAGHDRWTPDPVITAKVEPEPSPNSSAADVASPRHALRKTPPPRAQTPPAPPPPPPTNLLWCSASPKPRSSDALPLVRRTHGLWSTLPDLAPTLPDLARPASGSFSDAGDDEAPPPTSRARSRTVSDCRRPSVLARELADLSVSTRKRRRARSCDDDWGQFADLSGDENDRPRKLTISPALKIGSWPPRAV